MGGKGLFVKELETALLDGRADLAVHSLKDVPVDLQAPFSCAPCSSAPTRATPSSPTPTPRWPSCRRAPSCTSSLRREAQIRARHPQLAVKPLRGNLDTRLGKLDRGDYDAIVLAAAGLERLGLGGRIRSLLDPAVSLPAAGQGALGIEIRDDRDDMRAWLAPLVSAGTRACVLAERAVSRELGGSCQVPLAAFAELNGDALSLRALVASPDGVRMVRAERSGPAAEAEAIGVAAARELLDAGAAAILQELLQDDRPA